MTQIIDSIVAGPFEFPISGAFTLERTGSATQLTTVGGERHYIVGSFRNIAGHGSAKADQVGKLETLTRGNWERFAKEEQGKIVGVFQRRDTSYGITVFTMSTEFESNRQRHYYIQFADTDGPRFATIFAEGFGPALPALQELEPLVMKVKVVEDGT